MKDRICEPARDTLGVSKDFMILARPQASTAHSEVGNDLYYQAGVVLHYVLHSRFAFLFAGKHLSGLAMFQRCLLTLRPSIW